MNIDKRINILYILGQSHYLGGAEKALLNILKGLNSKKFNPLVILPCRGKLEHFFKSQGIKTKVFSIRYYKNAKNRILFLLNHNRIDIVHIITLRGFEFRFALIAKLVNIPNIWHMFFRFDQIYSDINAKKRRKLLELVHELSAKVVSCSRYVREQFEELGLHKNNVTIYNTADVDTFRYLSEKSKYRIREKFGIENRDFLVGMVSRFCPQKRPQDFIKAAAIVKNRFPDVRFVLVGGVSTKQFIRQLKKLNQENGNPVILMGFCNNINEYISAMDLLILPAIGDACPVAILEAMACQKPVVAVNSGGIPEIVLDGKTGLLVPPKKPSELAKAIIAIIKNPIKAECMGRAARQRVEKNYDIRRTIKKLQKLYLELLK